jgi:hypothetical protein
MLFKTTFLVLISQALASPKTVTLNNGVVMPLVSAGVWKYNGSEAQQSCESAYEVGFRAFDTAYDCKSLALLSDSYLL